MPAAAAEDPATEKVPVFQFMLVRPPEKVPAPTLTTDYIHDDLVVRDGRAVRVDADLQSDDAPSQVGRLVYQRVFCGDGEPSVVVALQELRDTLLALLPRYAPPCPSDVDDTAQPLALGDLERHAWINANGYYYLLPDQLGMLRSGPLVGALIELLPLLQAAAAAAALDPASLCTDVERVFDGQPLHRAVFADGVYNVAFRDTKRALFDALYLLYVMRRWASVDLGPVMDGLRALHALEALAVDQVYRLALDRKLDPAGQVTLAALKDLVPALDGWDERTPVPGLPLVGDAAALAAYLSATPVIHPLFARLFWYTRPFNDIKPIGIGDLKVVKQWLTAYVPGEIADIHNVMKGETKERVHRRLEKSEETFSFTGAHEEEGSKDTQSTDRYELKREAEEVLKTEVGVNANASLQYNRQPILATVSASLSYKHDDTQTAKTAQNFSHEVISKAVTRTVDRTTQQRSVTKIFETEETNKHSFTAAGEHVSGIYRWVDKRYKAQLYNYGKRMMFEFVVPEPAAFLVDARLRAFEAALDSPQPPAKPAYRTVQLPFKPGDIDEAKFDELRKSYDLAQFSFPAAKRTVSFLNQENGGAFFSEGELGRDDRWYAKSYTCRLNAAGYTIDKLRLDGTIQYVDHNNPPGSLLDKNIASLSIDGSTLWTEENNAIYVWKGIDAALTPAGGPYLLTRDEVNLALTFQDIERYDLVISADLSLGAAALLDWQTQVYKAVYAAESKAVDDANREFKLSYDSQLATYHNRLAELKAVVVNDLLQGRSEAYNRQLILTELRRQCLALLAKEFDDDPNDDQLTDQESVGTRQVGLNVTRLEVNEAAAGTTVGFKTTTRQADLPLIDLPAARVKGRHVQFLEQAFEWQQLGYVLYPYFWSTPPKWVQLLDRSDDADPAFTAFLQAGAARVLVAVTPAYDQAVLHFLATREPWEGGPAPAIGDPLYLPLYQELHRQQDDLFGAVPEGDPWEFTLPTSLVYLHGSSTPLPDLASESGPGP
jgi:hypothetical protein